MCAKPWIRAMHFERGVHYHGSACFAKGGPIGLLQIVEIPVVALHTGVWCNGADSTGLRRVRHQVTSCRVANMEMLQFL